MEKEKPKAIKTNKYLFHVSHPDFRNYIHREGLVPLVRPFKTVIPVGVYAHNVKTLPSYEWYPFVWPFEEDYELTSRYNNYDSLGMYDYWRIDTSLIDNEWHVDEIGRVDFSMYLQRDPKDMYVYTPKAIPREALTLFRFQTTVHYEYEGEHGTFHFKCLPEFREYLEIQDSILDLHEPDFKFKKIA